MTERAKAFWGGFNIGHALILAGMTGSLIMMYSQRERDMAVLQYTNDSQAAQIAALSVRMEVQERAIGKIDSMGTDIKWLITIATRQGQQHSRE